MKAYDNYKATNLDWIGKIPSHWSVIQLKFLLSKIYSGNTPSTSNDNFWDLFTENGIPWVAISDITKSNGILTETSKRITEEGRKDKGLEILPIGTLLLSIFASLGKTTRLGIEATINQAIIGLETNNKLTTEFLQYLLKDSERYLSYYSSASTQENLNLTKIKNLQFSIPSIEEQTAIASFLDYKTNLIDATIEKKKHLIEVLKEKRQAVINEAVTKGLNANASMKNSGVEWLGEIPENWSVVKLKHIANTITDGAHISPDLSTPDFPFISTVDLQKGEIMWEKCLMTSESNYFYLKNNGCKPEIGDVLYSKDGTIGKTTVIKEDKEFVVASSLIITKPNECRIIPGYLEYLLRSNISTLQIDALLSGVALRRVSLNKFSNLTIPLPPLDDQKKFLDDNNEMHKNYLISLAKLKKSILLLQNYRQSLISEAVTGKIDVRDWEITKN